MNVGIIGGGAAGLAAAYELSLAGHHVSVFERAPFLGGQASTFEVGGTRLERGYHHLFKSDVDMIWLINQLGLSSQLKWKNSKVGLFHSGRIWNFATPMDLLKFVPLSLVARVRLGLVSLYLQRLRNWRRFEDITAAKWLRRWVGVDGYEAVWEPLLRGKFGRYYDSVGMTWFWGKMALRFASRGKGLTKEELGYPMLSFGAVFDILGERIRSMGGTVETGSIVNRVVVENGRAIGLELQGPNQETKSVTFDAIISTVPSSIFTKLVPSLPTEYSSQLSSITYLAAVLIVLVLDRPLTSIYWLNIADRTIPFVAVIEQTNFIDKSHYSGKHIVYLANYLDQQDPLYQLNHTQLLEAYLPSLKRLNPQFDQSWIEESYFHRENAAQPVIGTDYARQVPSHKTPINDLYLANTTQIYPEDRGTNYSVRIGRKIAHLLLADRGYPIPAELPRTTIENSMTSLLR